ncbi:MAG TPA: ABC transporter permease [Candidatus Acidoferrales bacterium]|nr:ABC transporter permease [Candidatus Acidoferrales bacterium]
MKSARLRTWLRFFQQRREDEERTQELADYLARETEENIARGMAPQEARRVAHVKLGSTRRIREEIREMNSLSFLETLWQDARYAARMLRKSPGFTAVAVLTLALGIGANTAIFSAVNPILFEPLPYAHSERIMMIWGVFQGDRSWISFHNYRELLERNRSFDALAIFEPWQPGMSGPNEPERLDGQYVSNGYFRALGVAPAMGRDFQPSDDAYHGPHVAILSNGLWHRRFGGDRSIVGHQITLDGDAYTVIGIMPRGFDNVLSPTAEIWSPEQYNPSNIADTISAEWGNHLSLVGRLKPGVTFAQGKADIDMIAHTPVPEFPRPRWGSLRLGFIADSLQQDVTRGVKSGLLAVLGAVLLLLLIACVNVTNLLLARGAQRRGEFAVRAALGAGRGRMMRQLLTESLLLAAVGGALGLVVAQLGVSALVALSPADLPRVEAIGVNGPVFAFALGITTLIGLAVGLIPALHTSRSNLRAGLQQMSRSTVSGHQRTRSVLVVAEVALALVLLVSAGLLLRSLGRLFAINPGFDASHLLTMQVQISGHKYDDAKAARLFYQQALEGAQHVPGVQSAAFTSILPLTDDTQIGQYGAEFEKDNDKPVGGGSGVFRYVVTPDYLQTMHIPLREGRFLEKGDVAGAPFATVISESLAREEFGNQSPIDKRMKIGGFPNWPLYTIVGVAGDVKQASLSMSDPDAVYIAPEQSWFADQAMSLVLRTRGNAAALTPEIKKAVWSVDKDQPIVRMDTMEHLLARTQAERGLVLILFEAFGIVALALAAVGIYGVLSGSVTERTREIGIRLALGAPRTSILSLIVRQGMTLTVVGILIGLGGALAASQAIASQLFGVSPLDVFTYIGVVVMLGSVSVIACWAPAWRASRVDPAITLRVE